MNGVVLRFLLEGGHFLDVLLAELEAQALLTRFCRSEAFASDTYLGGKDLTGRLWAVEAKRVQALFTYPPQQVTTQDHIPGSGLPFPPGYNQR